jgi:hypothetical protein
MSAGGSLAYGDGELSGNFVFDNSNAALAGV